MTSGARGLRGLDDDLSGAAAGEELLLPLGQGLLDDDLDGVALGSSRSAPGAGDADDGA